MAIATLVKPQKAANIGTEEEIIEVVPVTAPIQEPVHAPSEPAPNVEPAKEPVPASARRVREGLQPA